MFAGNMPIQMQL